MLERIMGVIRLDVNTFEEIEHDESATSQALIIVIVVAVLSAISGFIGARAAGQALDNLGELGELGAQGDLPFDPSAILGAAEISPIGGAFSAFLGVIIAWLLWSGLTYLIGVNVFGGEATMGEMMRVIGFAYAPQVLGVLGFIPCIGWIAALAGSIWSLVCGYIGIRQGLDLDNGKTAATVVISWLIAVVVNLCAIGPAMAFIL